MNKKVIIITLNFNQNDYTVKCIASLLESTYDNYIILLIDNGSTEENYSSLRQEISDYSRIILKRLNKNCGYVGGINYGLEEGIKLNPDYFLIMNNDTVIEKNAISELTNWCLKFNNKAIVTGKVFEYDEPNKLQAGGYIIKNNKTLEFSAFGINEIDNGQYDSLIERDMIDDIFWLFPANLYKSIGGYSNYFWFNAEQADYALRAKSLGYKLICIPNAIIWHKGSASMGGKDFNPDVAYWNIQSSLILRYLHLNKIPFINYYLKTITSIFRTLIKSLYFKLSRKQDISQYAKGKLYGLLYFNKWIFKKNINIGYNPLKK